MPKQSLKPHDPLRGHSWRDGVEPAPDPTPAPQQQHPEGGYGIESRDHMLMLRATRIVRQLHGIPAGDFRRWGPQHDRAARTVYAKLLAGEELPAHWYSQRKEPPPIDPFSHITPRQSSR